MTPEQRAYIKTRKAVRSADEAERKRQELNDLLEEARREGWAAEALEAKAAREKATEGEKRRWQDELIASVSMLELHVESGDQELG